MVIASVHFPRNSRFANLALGRISMRAIQRWEGRRVAAIACRSISENGNSKHSMISATVLPATSRMRDSTRLPCGAHCNPLRPFDAGSDARSLFRQSSGEPIVRLGEPIHRRAPIAGISATADSRGHERRQQRVHSNTFEFLGNTVLDARAGLASRGGCL